MNEGSAIASKAPLKILRMRRSLKSRLPACAIRRIPQRTVERNAVSAEEHDDVALNPQMLSAEMQTGLAEVRITAKFTHTDKFQPFRFSA